MQEHLGQWVGRTQQSYEQIAGKVVVEGGENTVIILCAEREASAVQRRRDWYTVYSR